MLASRVPGDAVATFVQRLLSSQTSWAQHVGDHKVVQLPESDSPAFSERLAAGLQWLAAQAPQPPDLQVCHRSLPRLICHPAFSVLGEHDILLQANSFMPYACITAQHFLGPRSIIMDAQLQYIFTAAHSLQCMQTQHQLV